MDHVDDKIFQVSVKALFWDKDRKLMMIREKSGVWEIPGGRVQNGEDLLEGLRRECLEETGLECQILEQQPSIVYSAADSNGRARLMVYYKVRFNSLDFKPSDECAAINFYNKEEMQKLTSPPQIKILAKYL